MPIPIALIIAAAVAGAAGKAIKGAQDIRRQNEAQKGQSAMQTIAAMRGQRSPPTAQQYPWAQQEATTGPAKPADLSPLMQAFQRRGYRSEQPGLESGELDRTGRTMTMDDIMDIQKALGIQNYSQM